MRLRAGANGRHGTGGNYEFALATRPRFVAALINRMLTIRAKTPPL
jgi:hypothetical protein